MAKDVTIRQLRCFVALARTRHYRKAAERMGISQPSLSQQIVRLEGALGLALVERGRRGAVLSPAGREVLVHAGQVLDAIGALEAVSEGVGRGAAGTIRLGSTPTLGPYVLPYVVQRLHRDHPELKIVIRDAAPMVLQDELLAGHQDMILTQLPVASGDVLVERLFREPLKLVLAQDHPLAGQAVVRDADLAGRDFLTLSNAYTLHRQIRGICEELGAHLKQEYEGTSLDAVRQMTALNMGASFLPALYVNSEAVREPSDVVVLPFRADRVTRSIGLVWRRQSPKSTAQKHITEAIREVARSRFAGLVTVE